MPRVFALCDGDACEPTVFSGCAPLAKKTVQNAGHAFFAKFERISDSAEGAAEKKATRQDSGSDEEQSPSKQGKKGKKEKKDQEALKLAECLKGEDLYGLLEVDAGASQEDLKKAYRKICLTHHPDKHGDKTGAELEAVNEHFVKLQEAFTVLSDVKKRRKYDSMGDFDDWVPTKLKEGQDFFEVFAPVFKRNAKWSEHKPVPELGDMETPYEKVKAFYDFWFEFESWRDLDALIMEENGDDCFEDLENAECREEKRWMEKENARIRGKYLKAERQRIFGFVETAEKLDPRVRAEKDKQHAAREAAKLAKEAKRLEAERLAREEEERKAAAEEEERAARALEKAQREEEKQAKKAARSKLRKIIQDLDLGLAEHSLQDFLLLLEPAETESLTEELLKKPKKNRAAKDASNAEAVLSAMKGKGVEPVILSKAAAEEEKSTEEGSTSEEKEQLSPQEAARLKKEQEEKRKQQEARRKKEEEEQRKVREEEAAKRAEEKAARDLKKKAEQEKKDREQLKANKKEAEKQKREQEKKIKDEEKLAEKARLEKEANAKRAEEQRQKQVAENQAEQEAKLLEQRTFEFERDRLARCEDFEKLAWTGVIEASQALAENPIIASGLAAAAASYEDAEELLDAQLACLGSYFVLGKTPAEDQLPLSSGLRSKVKKLRTKIRAAAEKGEFTLVAPAGTKADNAALEQMLLAANGEGPHPADVAAAAAAPAAVEEPSAKSGKKKAKAKAAPAGEEDLDALLEEFGMTGNDGGKKKKGGKKK